MLNFFRQRETAVRVLLGFFLVVICVGMVVTLIPGFNSSSGSDVSVQPVATVGGEPITSADFRQQLDQTLEAQHLPAQFASFFGQRLLNQMVAQKALVQEARRLGLTVSQDELVQTLKKNPALFPNGQFVGQDRYAQFVSDQYQLSVPVYEQLLRDDLEVQKLQRIVTDGVRVTSAEVQQEFQRRNEKAKIDYVALHAADLVKEVKVTPEALAAYYQQNEIRYRSPERRKLDVFLADTTQFAARVQVSDNQVAQFYQANAANYSTPERVKASHILFKTVGLTPAAATAIKQKAEEVLKQVRAGGDFAALAKKYSEDPGSAVNGGELGFFTRGRMVKAFEDAAFTLQPGQVSDLVQTEYGFHIIKVEAHEAARTQPLAEVHDQIVQQMKTQKALDLAQTAAQQVRDALSRDPKAVPATVAQQSGVEYIATPPISRTDPITGVGVNPEFAAAAFSTSPGGLTQAIKVAQGFAVARVDEVQAPSVQPLAAVQAQVENDYRQQQATAMLTSQAQQLADAARKQGLKAAAAALHLTVKNSDPISRDDNLPELGPVKDFADQLFQLKPGQVGPPAAVNGAELVYAVVSIDEPTPDQFQREKDTVAQELLQQKRGEAFQLYADAVQARMNKAGQIKINDLTLRRVLGPGQPLPTGNSQ
ncbi:MAG: peptidylprolyl isomerase [Terriglobales bacterium]